MKVEHQAPNPKIEIFLPTNKTAEKADFIFEPSGVMNTSANLQNYTFRESVDDLEGSFSFTVINADVDNSNLFDLIPIRSVIKIYEGGDIPVFVGIIRKRQFSKAMTGQSVKQSVIFSGKSIISCVSEYMVSLDVRIQGVADAASKNKELTNALAVEDLSIKDYIKTTWEHFKNVSEDLNNTVNGFTNTAIADVISNFMGDIDDFVTVLGVEQKIAYNIATPFLNASNNSIVDIWRNILPQNTYELFSYSDRTDGKPKIMVRLVPFGDPDNGNNDWGNLHAFNIDPSALTAYNLEQSDEEVYTTFASYLIGSAMSREFYLATHQTAKDELVAYDKDKVAIYGFRPLEMNFNGYDRQGNEKATKLDDIKTAFGKLNKRAAYWYGRLCDMYSGSITLCTDFNEQGNNPRIGCRARFLGGEFYIEKIDHSWAFGGTPTIKLSVSRGMIYDEANGRIKGAIKNVGNRYRELEQDNEK